MKIIDICAEHSDTNSIILTGTTITLIDDVLTAGKSGLNDYAAFRREIGHSVEIKIYTSSTDSKVRLIESAKQASSGLIRDRVRISNINLLRNKRTCARASSLLGYIAAHVRMTCMCNDQLTRQKTAIPLKDLVDCGWTSGRANAYRDIRSAMRILQEIEVSCTAIDYHKKQINECGLQQLFDTVNVADGQLQLNLNPKFDWSTFLHDYVTVPLDIYRLSTPAYRIAVCSCRHLRRNAKKVDNNIPIQLSMKTIWQSAGMLYDRRSTAAKHEAIEAAVCEIEDMPQQIPSTDGIILPDLSFELPPADADHADYLASKINIIASGMLFASLSQISSAKTAHPKSKAKIGGSKKTNTRNQAELQSQDSASMMNQTVLSRLISKLLQACTSGQVNISMLSAKDIKLLERLTSSVDDQVIAE